MAIARPADTVLTARAAGLIACRRCARVWRPGPERCARCGERLASRDAGSLQHVWAWWMAGLVCYVPANIYPMLETRTLLTTQEDTIIGGAVELAAHGSWGVALIILVASVAIPVAKFVSIAYLAISVRRPGVLSRPQRKALYEVVEYIGRWSMIDVFVVALLSSLVQLGVVAGVRPGPASLAFALSVIFTMIAARSFDPRMIWDSLDAGPDRR